MPSSEPTPAWLAGNADATPPQKIKLVDMEGPTPGAPEPDLADTLAQQLAAMENLPDLPPVTVFPGAGMIFGKIIAVMREVSHVGKTGYNEQQRYNFRGIDAAVNALGPAMRKHGVFAVPRVVSMSYRDTLTTQDKKTREVTAQVEYTFYAEDGSSITAVVNGESLDTSDKGTAKAMSVAFRIVLLQVFALPTDEPTTDDSGQYHTRSGKSAGMSKFERAAGKGLLVVPTADQRKATPDLMPAAFRQAIEFKACIDEHDAWLQPVEGEDGPTWRELFFARVVAEIAACNTGEQVNALWYQLKEIGALPEVIDGKAVGVHLKERGAHLKELNAKAVDIIVQQITECEDVNELDEVVAASLRNAHEQGRINDAQRDNLHALLVERSKKLTAGGDAAGSSFNAPQGEQAAREVGM